jgi:hypothetical protein
MGRDRDLYYEDSPCVLIVKSISTMLAADEI